MAWHGLRHSARRVLGTWLAAGALATGYELLAVWLGTGAIPASLVWWLILPLALVVALLAAALMSVWEAAPALAAWRALRQTAMDVEAELWAEHQRHIVTPFDGAVTGPVVDEYPPEHTDPRRAA